MIVKETRANPYGPRFLTQRNLEKRIVHGDEPPRPPIAPGNMQLFSYYKPGLTAGNYAIIAEQFIDARKGGGRQSLRIGNWKGKPTLPADTPAEPQIFEVMAPQFSLDPKLVNSFYPPEGHQDEGRILPHIVINDPHLPWERDADRAFAGGKESPLDTARLRDPDRNKEGETIDKDNNVTQDREEMVYRSIVPWLRLLVFDSAELKLENAEQARDLGVPEFANIDVEPSPDIRQQPASGAFSMMARDYLKIKPNNRIDFEKAYEDDEPGFEEIKTGKRSKESASVIYPTKDTFYKLCKDVESNKYLAHVRNINTVGFPNASVEENGLFSIIISARTGSYKIEQPATQIVHLVSIEHVHSTLMDHFQDWESRPQSVKNERIGLISLYSWTYTALPPNPVNFIDSMMAIVGNIPHTIDENQPDLPLTPKPGNMQMLRPKDDLLTALASSENKESKLLASRLKLGYSIARWRSETGEVTAAFNRGPLTPVKVPAVPAKDWPSSSTTSQAFEILDKTTGIVDLSYAAAWNHGKTLAISDTAFSSSLLRFRSTIHNTSASLARSQVNRLVSKIDVLKQLLQGVKQMNGLLDDKVAPPMRVVPPHDRLLDTQLDMPDIAVAMSMAVKKEVTFAAQAGDEVFNEFNTLGENSTDWAAIHKWITDKLYLADIPAHILFPDPSFIPEESIRFFHIDDAWMDCLIDGALSVGNHLENDDDQIKNAIKALYNVYLSTTVPETAIKPQIPCFGFILRSQIVKVNWNTSGDSKEQRASVCQWIRPDDHSLICLLDRPPEELAGYNDEHPDRGGIVLSQPPHQQRFSFGHSYNLNDDKFEFRLRHLYTGEESRPGEWPIWDHSNISDKPERDAASKIDEATRVLKTSELASVINAGIQDEGINEYAYMDYVPNSAELALELNDPAYYFTIYPGSTSTNKEQRVRQLYIKAGNKTPPSPDKPTPEKSKTIGETTLVQPPFANDSVPIIPVPDDIPGKAAKVITIHHPTIPSSTGSIPLNMMPKKCFTMDVFVHQKGLRPRLNGAYDAGDYVPTKGKYLLEVRIVPRSAAVYPVMKMNDDKTVEASFTLTDIEVPESLVKKYFTIQGQRDRDELGFARIDMWERYQVDQDGLQVVSLIDPEKYFVLKREVED
ncbi:hypothetical protein CC78DRAFT_622237 [Lojkania enalia]|uniref:Uncharacterized protein n=1 Tax=Lojkania enalia TaxID=147567 RepID=A0A9P4JY08_9PLEO|nr:hypothetical protein CC78DRAFT_622237 [Didymosphaeria enalia]